ncbi:MAG: phosphotransferase, partial [Candidatus Limnocylindrales bacterium]
MSHAPTDMAPRPVLDAELAARVAEERFGVRAEHVDELPSERDRNFRLTVDGQPRFVLKAAGPAETRDLLEAQNAAMRHLAAHLEGLAVPEPRAATDGSLIVEATDGDGVTRLFRLLTWLPGETLAAAS